MAKNLKPCNFIVTVGGKKVSMPYDAMRKYLLENPDVWMPSSTRKIGAGKAQASLGGREISKPIAEKDVVVKKSDDFANDGEYVVFDNDKEIGRLWYDRSQKNWSNPNFYRPNAEPYSFESVYGDILGETKDEAVAEIIKRYNKEKKEEGPKISYVKDEILNNFLNILNGIKSLAVNPISKKEFIYDDRAALEFSRFNKGNRKEIELQDIAVFNKGKGEGMSVMRDITDAADKAGIVLTLEAKPFGTGGLGKKDLINFYKKNGFVVDYEEAYGGEFDNEKDLVDYVLENESEGAPMKRTPKEGAKIQASEGGRGEGSRGKENKDINDAIIAAGKAYRAAGNSKDAAVSTGVKFLIGKGMTEQEAYDAIAPLLEAMITSAEEQAKPGSFEDPAGWIKMGLIPQEVLDTISIERTTMQATLEIGMNAIKKGDVNPRELTEAFADGLSRPLTATEVSALVAYKVSLSAQLNKAYTELERANQTTSDQRKLEAMAKVKQLERELENYYITSRKSAYEMGLAFRTRQMLLDTDYNLIDLKQKYRAKYNALPPEISAEWEELNRQKEELTKREEQLISDREAFERDKAMAGLAQEVEQRKRGKDVSAAKDASFIVRNLLNGVSKIPSIFSRGPKGQASAGLRAGEQSDGEYIWVQAVTMVADFIGKKAKPEKAVIDEAIKKGVDYIKSTKWYKEMSPDEQKEAVSIFTSFTKQNTKAPGVSVSETSEIKISHDTLRKYTEQVLEDNPMDKDDARRYEKLMKAVSEAILGDMAAELPAGTSWEDIRDAITKYGQTSHPSKEDLEVEIRNMKEIGRKMAQLEAVLSGNKPLKSGYQRDPQSPEARRLVEQINEGLKKLVMSEMDSEAFLRSSLDRIKKSLQNQINDLDLQIKEGKRRDKNKSKVEYDEEATMLKELRDLLKKELDKIDPKDPRISAEKQLNNLIGNLEASILEYQRRIVEKDFSAFKKVKAVIEGLPQTQKYKDLLAERNALRKQLQDLKKGPEKTPLEKRMDALQKEYDSLLDGTYQPKQPPVQYNDPALTDLRNKIKDLKTQMGFKKTAEDIKIERLRKELSDLMQGIVKNKPPVSPDSPEAAAIRQQIQDLKDQMGLTMAAEINRAEKAASSRLKALNNRIQTLETTGQDVVGKQKVESAILNNIKDEIKQRQEVLQGLLDMHGITIKKLLKSEKERVNKIIEEKERRISAGDFAPKISTKLKLTKADYDDEMRDIMAQRQAINERYEEAFYRAELAKRNNWRKAIDFLGGAWNLTKSLRSSFDLSAPLRQGLFEVLSQKPTTTAKGLAFMMRAAFQGIVSRENVGKDYEEWLSKVKTSPEYEAMKASKLFIADRTGKGKAAEDAFVNNLVRYVPFLELPVGWGTKKYSLNLYTRSELAYNAFLNYMRVAAFKEVMDTLGDLDEPITFETNPEEFKAIAEVINVSTGRASLGSAESSANAINTVVFSIRLVLSRLMFLFIPAKAPFMPPAARKYAMIKYARAISSLSTIIGMLFLYLNSDDDDETYVELDPRGKFARINLNENVSVDLTAGLAQWITLLSRIGTQEYKTSNTGEIKTLGESSYSQNFDELIMGFVSGKMSPSARIAYERLSSVPNPEVPGERITKYGQKYDLLNSLGLLAVPMIVEEGFSISKAMESPYKSAALTALTGLGGTVSVKSERYELPSEATKKVFKKDSSEYDANQKKIKASLQEGDASGVNKLLNQQVKATIEKEGYVDPDIEANKFYYLDDLFNQLCKDKEGEKSGLTTENGDSDYIDNREAFFILMSGNNFPEIDPSMSEEDKEKTIMARMKFNKKFQQIPEEKRIGVLKNYGRQAKEREKIVETLNKLNVKVDGEKVNWREARLNGIVDWYFQFETYKDTPNFKKYLSESK